MPCASLNKKTGENDEELNGEEESNYGGSEYEYYDEQDVPDTEFYQVKAHPTSQKHVVDMPVSTKAEQQTPQKFEL